ncbi:MULTISPECIES: hypothetical protein [Clostridia]|uniref:hypothetical protein n=1 Tax=Clostridia TaxID=186801 RepID=UPI0011C49C00|nr:MULTISPECIES: hypothetical protein [Clostridia]
MEKTDESEFILKMPLKTNYKTSVQKQIIEKNNCTTFFYTGFLNPNRKPDSNIKNIFIHCLLQHIIEIEEQGDLVIKEIVIHNRHAKTVAERNTNIIWMDYNQDISAIGKTIIEKNAILFSIYILYRGFPVLLGVNLKTITISILFRRRWQIDMLTLEKKLKFTDVAKILCSAIIL